MTNLLCPPSTGRTDYYYYYYYEYYYYHYYHYYQPFGLKDFDT